MRSIPTLTAGLLATLLPVASWAEVPKVVTDIGPTSGLVSGVMAGLGTPTVLVPAGADPHHFQLRPSQARDLANAQAVIWIGHGLTPWLERVIDTTAPDAMSVELEDAEGMTHLAPMFGGEHHHDDEAEDDHDDHDHAEGDHDEEEGHSHGSIDPHVWLSPDNARAMTIEIAARLSELDPENAATYAANADKVMAELDQAEVEARELLADHHAARLVVFHDAYTYFTDAFDVNVVASLADSEAASPGAAGLQALRQQITESGADCLFAETQQPSALVQSLSDDTGVPLGTLDPLAGGTTPGAVWVELARSIDSCLSSD
ncbi:zinc ABC transporter substrate-binding protein [Frigidibacter sp. ROC022]|uniref:zinc ABC transporter substrate-binding protein n=1 Tax=Frigidibacter sp. ROC022 TaxID=2971796 RepID=UPI00215B057E|nr:zinc ABC transporter substrate-binding protein [Frigidibacter sp. ROC022]MCR8726699.1 zinc ABC transporter substrate-binding protein [Frigidibacter sp. ROC022]